MNDLERRVTELCACPTGCGFLIVAEEAKLTPEEAADPALAVHVAAVALSQTFFFRAIHEWTIAVALEQGPRLLPMARAVLAQPSAAWWFAPVDPTTQEWIGPATEAPDPARLVIPAAPPTRWERYAQKPTHDLVTSSTVGGTSSALAALTHYSDDYEGEPPLARYRLRPAAGARIFEVDGPEAWYRLCSRYPAEDLAGQLVPDWAAVATDWDGVHVTLGALLTADQMRFDGDAGWTEMRACEFEQTRWLRWCFEAVERLPDVLELPDPPVPLNWPWSLRPPGLERTFVRHFGPDDTGD